MVWTPPRLWLEQMTGPGWDNWGSIVPRCCRQISPTMRQPPYNPGPFGGRRVERCPIGARGSTDHTEWAGRGPNAPVTPSGDHPAIYYSYYCPVPDTIIDKGDDGVNASTPMTRTNDRTRLRQLGQYCTPMLSPTFANNETATLQLLAHLEGDALNGALLLPEALRTTQSVPLSLLCLAVGFYTYNLLAPWRSPDFEYWHLVATTR